MVPTIMPEASNFIPNNIIYYRFLMVNATLTCQAPVPRFTRVQVLNLMPSSLQIFTQSAAESPSASLLPILYSRCRQYNIHGKDPLFYIRSALHIS